MCFINCNNTNPTTPRMPTGPGRGDGDMGMRKVAPSSFNNAAATPTDVLDRSTKPVLGKSVTALASGSPQGLGASSPSPSSGALSTQIANIADSLVQTASQVVGAIAGGLKSLIDAGVGLIGIGLNIASEFLSFL